MQFPWSVDLKQLGARVLKHKFQKGVLFGILSQQPRPAASGRWPRHQCVSSDLRNQIRKNPLQLKLFGEFNIGPTCICLCCTPYTTLPRCTLYTTLVRGKT